VFSLRLKTLCEVGWGGVCFVCWVVVLWVLFLRGGFLARACEKSSLNLCIEHSLILDESYEPKNFKRIIMLTGNSAAALNGFYSFGLTAFFIVNAILFLAMKLIF
jgi:hypothetical protein